MSHNSLTKNAKRFLRGIGHSLHPLVTIAEKGLTENIISEIKIALDHHELIKIKIRADRKVRKQLQIEIIEITQSRLIQAIGQVITIYRANSKKPVYTLPK